jgi:hypothetical protein
MLPSVFALIVGTIIVISVTFVVVIIIIIMSDTSWSFPFNQTPNSSIATCNIALSNVYFFLGNPVQVFYADAAKH